MSASLIGPAFFAIALIACSQADAARARAYLFAATNATDGGQLHNVGRIDFTVLQDGKHVHINGSISGLTPGNHGFHIHEFGDYGNNCMLTGVHFNPRGATHGSRTSADRHAGDLGNVLAQPDGSAQFSFEDSTISLDGEESIIGRAVVVHAQEDTGVPDANAGARIACGIIGILE